MNTEQFFLDTYALPLTLQERTLLRHLALNGPTSSDDLLAWLLRELPTVHGRDDGIRARRLLRVLVHRCRVKLAPSGWTIPKNAGGRRDDATVNYGTYTLRRVGNGRAA